MLTINHPAPEIQYPSPHAIDCLKAVKIDCEESTE